MLRLLLSSSVSSEITAFRLSQPVFWVYLIQYHSTSEAGPLFRKHCMCQQMLYRNCWNDGVWHFGPLWIIDPQLFLKQNFFVQLQLSCLFPHCSPLPHPLHSNSQSPHCPWKNANILMSLKLCVSLVKEDTHMNCFMPSDESKLNLQSLWALPLVWLFNS